MSCTQPYTLKFLRELKRSQEEEDAMKQELIVLGGSVDAISMHIVLFHCGSMPLY